MKKSVVIFQSQGSYESSFQTASIAVVAAVMGDEVTIVFSFGALRAWGKGVWGAPENEIEHSEMARAEAIGASQPYQMLTEARKLGARVVACETIFRLVEKPGELDEVLGLASILNLTKSARILNF